MLHVVAEHHRCAICVPVAALSVWLALRSLWPALRFLRSQPSVICALPPAAAWSWLHSCRATLGYADNQELRRKGRVTCAIGSLEMGSLAASGNLAVSGLALTNLVIGSLLTGWATHCWPSS